MKPKSIDKETRDRIDSWIFGLIEEINFSITTLDRVREHAVSLFKSDDIEYIHFSFLKSLAGLVRMFEAWKESSNAFYEKVLNMCDDESTKSSIDLLIKTELNNL